MLRSNDMDSFSCGESMNWSRVNTRLGCSQKNTSNSNSLEVSGTRNPSFEKSLRVAKSNLQWAKLKTVRRPSRRDDPATCDRRNTARMRASNSWLLNGLHK